MKNLLMIHNLYDDCTVYGIRLSDDYDTAIEQAQDVFRKDIQMEHEVDSTLDENNTYWDTDEAHGELVWAGGQKATYDVLSDEYMCDYEKEYGQRTNLTKG